MTEIRADHEFDKLKKHAFDNIDSLIDLNIASANEHVLEIEQNNRTVKERVRAAFSHQPCDVLLEQLIIVMTHEAVK